MNPHITKALAYLQNAHCAGYFEEMDKVNLPTHLQTLYSEHKLAYMGGNKSFDFAQRLTVFAQEVGKTAESEANKQETQHINGISHSKNVISGTTIGNIGGDFKIGDNN
jgi:hypothetical protein